jgi:hypothetical protein
MITPNPSPTPLNPDATSVQTHLNLLQAIITRMATNSSNCKNWCITIVSALLVFIADKGKTNFISIALIPILLFCFLDAYYLAQERAFRESYNTFVKTMHTGEATPQDLFKITPQRGFNIATYTLNALTSFAIYPFYLSLLTMLAIAYYFLSK